MWSGPRAAVPAPGALILKPADGEGGSGIRRIDWTGGDRAGFAALLEGQPGIGRSRLIVQPRLVPHPVLAGIALVMVIALNFAF